MMQPHFSQVEAVKIQRLVRGHLARRQVQMEKRGATVLQVRLAG